MTERITASDPTPPLSPEELLVRSVDEIALVLRTWHHNRDSDSVRIQDMRAREYAYGCDKLEETIYAADREGFQIGLTAGDEPVETTRFRKGAYDMLHEGRGRTIAPGEMLPLERSERIISGYAPHGVYQLYVGSIGAKLEAATLAELLAENKATLGLHKKEELAD